MGLTVALAAAALAATPAQFVASHQLADGSFAEPGGKPDLELTEWALLGLRAAGAPADDRYLRAHEGDLSGANELSLAVLAEAHPSSSLVDRLAHAATGGALNATAWKLLALARAGRPLPAASVRYLLRGQSRSGGWSWHVGVASDSNDTAAVVQALRAAHVGGRPIARGLAYLRARETRGGGFELTPGRGSDAQSTAWAVQAFVAAGKQPPRAAFRYLMRLRRSDGSYRYDARYAVTPVWVTSQVLPALARRAFPLR